MPYALKRIFVYWYEILFDGEVVATCHRIKGYKWIIRSPEFRPDLSDNEFRTARDAFNSLVYGINMEKDRRYYTIKKLIISGSLESFREIFEIIPRSIVARDLGTHPVRLKNAISNLELFYLGEIYKLASLFEVTEAKMLQLINEQHMADNNA
jgi:hypothetical protein